MIFGHLAQTNSIENKFTELQLSFSTAEIQKNIFFGNECKALKQNEPTEKDIVLVVNGDMYRLDEKALPQPCTPLTDQSGLFKLLGLSDQLNL